MRKVFVVIVMLVVVGTAAASYAASIEQFAFRATKNAYWETSNVANVCQNEFGPNYRLADWNDIVWFKNAGGSMDAFFDEMGMPAYNAANFGSYYLSLEFRVSRSLS